MPFTSLNSTEIAAGKPVTNELMSKIKDNFDNHESRITDIENGQAVDYPPIILRVNGSYSDLSTGEKVGVLKTTINFGMEVTGIRIIVDKAGTSGTLSVDVLKLSGGSFVSLLTSQPTVASSSGNDASSTNAILDTTKTVLSAGDILKLDITSVQADGYSFMVRIDYEKVG